MINGKDRILLIGSGTFIQETVLPVILINKDLCSVHAIINKTGKIAPKIEEALPKINVETSISSISPESIDTIFICIPQRQVLTCVKDLLDNNFQHKKIIISTPIVPLTHLSQLTVFKEFTHLYAFEFVPYLKTYQVARDLLDSKKIGKLKKIQLNHSGYLYHGVSALRFLTKNQTISRIGRERFGPFNEYRFTFNDNISANILEPKDYNVGQFMIAGGKGIISSYPLAIEGNHYIHVETDDAGLFQQLTVNGTKIDNSVIEKQAIEYLSNTDSTPTLSRQLFVMAAATLLSNIIKQESDLPRCYDAIYEHLVIRIAKKIGMYFNPFALFNMSLLNTLLHWLTLSKNKRG